MANRCTVDGCNNEKEQFWTQFFNIPSSDPIRLEAWSKALGKPHDWRPQPAESICWSHFETVDLVHGDGGTVSLLDDAVPSILVGNSAGAVEESCALCGRQLRPDDPQLEKLQTLREGDRKLLDLIVPTEEETLSELVCVDCVRSMKLTLRFLHNCWNARSVLQYRRAIDSCSDEEANYEVEALEEVEWIDADVEAKEKATETLLQCPQCPYTCERTVQLASHSKKHPLRLLRCEYCEFQCSKQRQMNGHRSIHSQLIKTGKPPKKLHQYKCNLCGNLLATRSSYAMHMKYHYEQKDYPCPQCGKKFYSKRDVTMHVESYHDKKVFSCDICGVRCTWKNALQKHMRKHRQESYKHECEYCHKKFIAANELRLHVWTHTGEKLICEICGKGYRFNFILTQHKMREHGIKKEGVKLYKRFRKPKKWCESPGEVSEET